jgi:formylglycine-generating enzyme required for sulfatase activity
MKNTIKVGICILIVLLSFSFSIKKTKKFIPPGTVQITETFFADETEISNFSWLEYEIAIKTKYGTNSAEHKAILPDTLVWREKNSYNEPYVIYYYRHPAYRNFPVVGVSYEQAVAYCKWRTEEVKKHYSIIYKKEVDIEYRLPSKTEWELISNNGKDVLHGFARNSKGQILFNHRYLSDSAEIADFVNNHTDVTAPVKSYWKNTFGLFNTIGNVAEMINENGICKGGSWRHEFEECRAGKDITYTKPSSWLGFRCVCVVKST